MKTGFGRAIGRREFLKTSALAGGAALALPGMGAFAAGNSINYQTWSAAVDLVKSHIAAFEKASGLTVDYANAPWAQYRDAMVTKFVGAAPMDVLWVSDAWLPEWAEAKWIAPINAYDNLMAYNSDAEAFCTDSMTYKGEQYGLTYYTDYMGFIYDAEKLSAAGFSAPPASWDELVEQALVMKEKGIAEFPMMLAMAKESWLIEFMSAMVFSHGGRFTDDKGDSIMQEEKGGALSALQWVVDAVSKHKIVSPGCVETGELNGLKAFAAGNHAFAMLPKYRLAMLNDPGQSQIAGRAKQALMPMGANGSHATVGWMRFHGMSAQAAADKARSDNAAKLIEWFGGKANGQYMFQKLLFLDLGSGFGVKPLFEDADVRAAYNKYGDVEMIQKQQTLAQKKDVITPWFGDWSEVNGAAWQSAILGNATPADALKKAGEEWDDLKSQS
ncbi:MULTISPECIES: extracellular solute-binding protein [Alphaproteobacteria]|uniref:Bicyclomycin resistance protein n=2 Tax=Alphaproteobacteria TaxID=28211 RepID=A0A512HH60_9HYPH|nr:MULTISPECIES: extracellular solute-binding protein [Alphaproteobacteria]GEO84789.1 bicyclomycin resistance protein [Ciceribacter naphthalenivorans]GLR20590.1 bicyclomycin resistance protein [Ciceribacter naphthalenivorans]GLT03446.1 bicyclomycin resistance protein [Sphingomonas psychrolutea]